MSNIQVLQLGELVRALTQIQPDRFKPGSLFPEDFDIPAPRAETSTDAGRLEEHPQAGHGVLKVRGVAELTAAHVTRFRKQVSAALDGHRVIEVDLSQTASMDCAGLGALLAIRNLTRERKGVVRLVNPSARVRQLLALTRTGQVFEIVETPV